MVNVSYDFFFFFWEPHIRKHDVIIDNKHASTTAPILLKLPL